MMISDIIDGGFVAACFVHLGMIDERHSIRVLPPFCQFQSSNPIMPLAPTTRASLILRLRGSRDYEAWVEFEALYEPMVYRLLRRSGLQDADARDVMQNLFVAVSQNIDRWDPRKERGSFAAWLRRVTRNLIINWMKQRERRPLAVGGSGYQSLINEIPSAAGPETVEFDLELRRTLFQRAADLVRSEVHLTTWQAFWETAVLGTSPSIAATKLGMQVGAIRVAKCRVLARLQAVVNQMEADA